MNLFKKGLLQIDDFFHYFATFFFFEHKKIEIYLEIFSI